MVLDVASDRTTVRARFIVGDPAVASQLGVAISQMLTTWNRTQGAAAPLDARARVDGGDTIAEFRIPPTTLAMLAERAGILARQPGRGAVQGGAPMSQIDPFRRP